MMRALLLNSGTGSRMGMLTADRPKTMCTISSKHTILSNQVELLYDVGVRDVVVTTGPFAEQLEGYCRSLPQPMHYTFVNNPVYRQTNYIYSMNLAGRVLAGHEVLCLHGDLVMEPAVLERLATCKISTMVVDSTLPLPAKDFKARIFREHIIEIGVDIAGEDCMACQPAYYWTAEGFAVWMQEIDRFCARKETNVYAENAFNALQGTLTLAPLDIQGQLCSEIDNEEDWKQIKERFGSRG